MAMAYHHKVVGVPGGIVVVVMVCIMLLLVLLGLPFLLLRERERDHSRRRLCHLCLLHFQTQQTIVSSKETRVHHDHGVRRAAVGCRGLSRMLLRVAAGVNCASVLGDCHHFNVSIISSVLPSDDVVQVLRS